MANDRTDFTDDTRASDTSTQVPMYHAEHMLAYIVAIGALALATIGLLVGFDVFSAQGASPADDAVGGSNFWDALVWLVPAAAAAFLSMALHRNDHHLARNPGTLTTAHEGMWNAEHFGAWLVAALSIAAGTIGILVGYDIIERGNGQFDGILWGFAALVGSVLTNTLHSVRHHQVATTEDYILGVVDKRMSTTTTRPATRTPQPRS